MNAVGFPTFSKPVAAPKRAERTDSSSDKPTTVRNQNSAEFAAFLGMLVNGDAKLRTDLLKQLPAEGASLLDHLLAGNVEGTSDDAATALETTPEATIIPSKNATDSVRYGMLASTLALAKNTNIVSPATDNIGAATRGVHSPSGDTRITPAVLARIASGKLASVEELMARGDREGAVARAKLDDLLSKAGTSEGLNLSQLSEMNAALQAALAASAADVSTPVKDIEAVDPELRSRFDRISSRMKEEFGHDVTIVETARSQARQDHLYAQGRTTPGNVVTWTTDSAHTHGEAIDVVVDGSWNNPTGFARLQQIAKEEGLRTIPNDPGHLELPREEWTNNADVRVTSAFASGNNAKHTGANGVAQVATVARVASVASAANSGQAATTPAITQQETPVNASLGVMADRSNGANNSNSNTNNSENSGNRDERSRKPLPATAKATEHANERSAAYDRDKSGTQNASAVMGGVADSSTRFVGPVDQTERPAGATAAEAAERVDSINTMRAQQGKSVSQMTLEVEGPNGTTHEIKVDVRGNTVGTTITADSASADRMRSNVNELKTGLESRGLEPDTVRISTQGSKAADATDAARAGTERDAARMSGVGASGNSAGNDGAAQQQRDRSSAARDWEDRQATRDEQRAQQDRAGRDAQNQQRRGSSSQGAERPQYREMR